MGESLAQQGRRTLEAVLRKLGFDPPKLLRVDTPERVVYALRRGSADVVVSVGHSRGSAYVRVASPVLTPPEEPGARTRLLERLLELNAQGLSNAAFGLFEGKVVVASERPVQGLDETELEQMLTHLSAVADTFDDRLVGEFGGRRASDG